MYIHHKSQNRRTKNWLTAHLSVCTPLHQDLWSRALSCSNNGLSQARLTSKRVQSQFCKLCCPFIDFMFFCCCFHGAWCDFPNVGHFPVLITWKYVQEKWWNVRSSFCVMPKDYNLSIHPADQVCILLSPTSNHMLFILLYEKISANV